VTLCVSVTVSDVSGVCHSQDEATEIGLSRAKDTEGTRPDDLALPPAGTR
jgi:hypothetical protein